MKEPKMLTIDEISAMMFVRHISVRQMAKMLGVNSSRVHAMFKYKDEKHNKLLRLAMTYVLNANDEEDEPFMGMYTTSNRLYGFNDLVSGGITI